MQIQSIGDFLRLGAGVVPNGDYVAVGIAPSSEVDVCIVGDRYTLSPGSLVPCKGGTKLTAVRGYRTIPSGGTIPYDPIGGTLDLLLYQSCDLLSPPGPRARLLVGNLIDYTAPNAALLLRVPFSGRKHAVVSVKREFDTTTDLNITVRGIRYRPREVLRRFSKAVYESEQSFMEVAQTETYFNGAGSLPESTLDGDTYQLGRVFYVGGGGDNQEGFDELEVWVDHASSSSVIWGEIEVNGERG